MKIFIKTLLLIIIAFLIYFVFPQKSSKLIYIPNLKKDNAKYAFKLQDTPINRFDTVILKFFNAKKGWVRVTPGTSRYKLFKEILEKKREKTRKIVIYGGDNLISISEKIAKLTNLNAQKIYNLFIEKMDKKSTVLTGKYNIPYNATENSIVAYILYQTDSFFSKLAKREKVKYPGKIFTQKLIIASIVEKETQDYNEMALISAVIQNRLKKNMYLQIDATLNHGKQSHTIVTHKLIKDDNSKFNTYKHKGLPPKPLGSISKTALISAFVPAKADYLYFVKNPKGGHIFSKTYKKHIKRVKIYKDNLAHLKAKKYYKYITKSVKLKLPNPLEKIKVPIIDLKSKK